MSNDPSVRPRRVRFRPLVAIVIVNLVGFGIYSLRASRERADTRACHANQLSLIGSVEMYALEHKLDSKKFTLGPALHAAMKASGFYRTERGDPGQGPGSVGNYALDPTASHGITCKIHGPALPLKKR